MKNLDDLRKRLAASTVRASQHKLLASGPYSFKITDAKERTDEKRGYAYVYLELSCQVNGAVVITTDRFPITDSMLWKLAQLLASIESTSMIGQASGNSSVGQASWSPRSKRP